MRKLLVSAMVLVAGLGLAATPASAHFQMLYPGHSARMPAGDLDLAIIFTHPFTGGPTMEMGTPEAFYMVHQRGNADEAVRTDLMPLTKKVEFSDANAPAKAAYKATIPGRQVRSMGDYIFVFEPAPYYEPTEDKYIQQFTKTIVNIGGVPGAWDKPVGDLPAEIQPLDRPYANWQNGVFRGIVLAHGKPVPFAEIEVEYVNYDLNPELTGWIGKPHITAPHPSLEAMSLRADANGAFSIGLPRAGWWGIAALDVNAGTQFQGKPLSQDAVLWVEATPIE